MNHNHYNPKDKVPKGPAGASSAKKDVEDELNAFDKEHAHEVIIIQLMRIYDLLLAQLAFESPQKAEQIVALHEIGQTFMPAPSFSVSEE